jgi:hypothetical protein
MARLTSQRQPQPVSASLSGGTARRSCDLRLPLFGLVMKSSRLSRRATHTNTQNGAGAHGSFIKEWMG